jgi:hypothetical protein
VLATGAIMQGLPLVATAGSPATLALFYLTRIVAMPAVNMIQALDALQKTALRSAVRDRSLLRSTLVTAGSTIGITIGYACSVTALLPALSPLLGSAYSQITAADLWAWTGLLIAQVASGTADNAAYALNEPLSIATGRITGACVAFALWLVLAPITLPHMLVTMAIGFVVSGTVTTDLLAHAKHQSLPREGRG